MTATTTKSQQTRKNLKGVCFAKYFCHANPRSDISDPVLFGLEVLDSPVQMPSAQNWRKLNTNHTYLFMILSGHRAQELPGVASSTSHETTNVLDTFLQKKSIKKLFLWQGKFIILFCTHDNKNELNSSNHLPVIIYFKKIILTTPLKAD